ncbi:fatty acyl-CoA reductase 3-like [Senna tora]|uniref:Fatty acyl-CoA reductase 3-like n=1 Tax=Senna tora TaxID=362788 RepID=A0A834SXM1_9FABA|nr:fatty acyl-CoA reductase 3-like [Senna tora]
MDSFRRYMFIRYLLLLKGLELANTAFCQYFQETYLELNRKIQIVMRFRKQLRKLQISPLPQQLYLIQAFY